MEFMNVVFATKVMLASWKLFQLMYEMFFQPRGQKKVKMDDAKIAEKVENRMKKLQRKMEELEEHWNQTTQGVYVSAVIFSLTFNFSDIIQSEAQVVLTIALRLVILIIFFHHNVPANHNPTLLPNIVAVLDDAACIGS